MNNILYLDLEQTLINDFRSNKFITDNIKTIKSYINKYKINKFKIFSLAVLEDRDEDYYNKYINKTIENCLECKFDKIIRIDKFLDRYYKFKNIHTFDNEISVYACPALTKQMMFELFCEIEGEPYSNHILIDDYVVDKRIYINGKIVTTYRI